MLLLSNEDICQKYTPIIYALALSKVKKDGPATVIASESIRQYEARNKRVAFADEKTLELFLRKIAERLCEPYLKRAARHESSLER
jgi:hypothetical protein